MNSNFDIHSAVKFISDKTGRDEPIVYKIVHKSESLTDEDYKQLERVGELDLSGIKQLKKLPDNLTMRVVAHIILDGSGIEEFPKNLDVGMIDIRNTPLEDKLIQIGVEHFIKENAALIYHSSHDQYHWFDDFLNVFLQREYGFDRNATTLLINKDKFVEELSKKKSDIEVGINSLRNMIQESVIEAMDGTDLEEATYPSSFNMEEFKKLTSFNARIEYCKQHLKRIAAGTSRIVYRIDDQTVLKLAKNKKGIAQNSWEADRYIQSEFVGSVAKVLESDPNDYWIEMQYAKRITEKRFGELVGIPFSDFAKVMQEEDYNANPKTRRMGELDLVDEETRERVHESELGSELIQMMSNYNIVGDDWTRISSYGELDGEVVVIDYGLHRDDFNRLYLEPRDRKAQSFGVARMYENID